MDYKLLNITQVEGYQICQLNNGRGNAISIEMIRELNHYFSHFTAEQGGVILTGKDSIFTVGLDMKQIIMSSDDDFQSFFDEFLAMVHTLAKFKFPFISAINGHCPAGGCVLAICSDFRIMADNEIFTIGLNELEVGLMVPPAIFTLYKFWIGTRTAYENLITGKMLNPIQAKKQGLVDELLPQEEVLNAAKQKMRDYLSFDSKTWYGIKHNLRIELIKDMEKDASNEHFKTVDHFRDNDGRNLLMKKILAVKAKKEAQKKKN